MSRRSNVCESSSSSSKHTHWTAKLRSMIRNMWSIPLPRPPTLSSPPEELQANILELEQSITWMRSGSPRLHESMFTMSCRASSNPTTLESIHRAKHGRSLSMDVESSVPILRPLTPVSSSVLPVPESLLVNLSDLKRDKTPLSQGAGCAVYKAVHNPTGRLYALKVVYTEPEDSVIRSQILQEFQVHREVANPNFVKCYDVFHRTGEVHVLLEFMDGGSLKGKHVQNEKALSDLARQVLTGLAYLHRRRVVHRDIKPANLLINTQNEQVKIADFVGRASAKTMDPWNSCVGNIAYMSPERINPDHSPGKHDAYAGDVWSFGVSILELYLGRYPFSVDRYQDGYWSLLSWAICMSEPPEAPPTASRELRHFIACCLQREPNKRFSAAKLLKHPFVSGNGGGQTSRRQGHH